MECLSCSLLLLETKDTYTAIRVLGSVLRKKNLAVIEPVIDTVRLNQVQPRVQSANENAMAYGFRRETNNYLIGYSYLYGIMSLIEIDGIEIICLVI